MSDRERGVQRDRALDRQKMRRKMALLERMKQGRNGFEELGVGSSDGKRQGLPVTCSHIRSFISQSAGKGEFFFHCSLFDKMTLDDESDPFRGEVSLWRDY